MSEIQNASVIAGAAPVRRLGGTHRKPAHTTRRCPAWGRTVREGQALSRTVARDYACNAHVSAMRDLAMAIEHANGACATIVINNDLVRVVGW